MRKMKCASFFAGVGGIDLGFEQAGFEVVYANEFDPYPAQTYELNNNIKVDVRDIREVVKNIENISDFDVLLAGFPCQAFSVAGLRKGFDDEKGRGTLFFELIKIIRVKKPKIVFLENVKNLVSHNNGDTFETILDALHKEGYATHYKVLNAKDYGIPQNRERVYVVAFLDDRDFVFPEKSADSMTIKDIIGFRDEVEEKYYYRKGKYAGDIYEKLKESVISMDTVYQWRRHYVRENKSGVIPTLTANMGGGGHNVPIVLTDYGIRKLTPKECFLAQGFPDDFRLPQMSDSRLYKQAGNSVCVSVIHQIAENIMKSIE